MPSCVKRRKRFSFDVTGAYLQGKYTKGEEVYARPPRGYRVVDPVTKVPIVWKMMTPLYGQGDAGLVWFRTIKNQLTREQSFNQSDSDPSYFWKRT